MNPLRDGPLYPDKGWWLLVTVRQKKGYTKSVWNSYYKIFHSGPNESATTLFLKWWNSLSDTSYTKTKAIVHLHWCVDGGNELMSSEMFPDTVAEFLSLVSGE